MVYKYHSPDLQTLSRISDLLHIDIEKHLVIRNQAVQPLTKDIKINLITYLLWVNQLVLTSEPQIPL